MFRNTRKVFALFLLALIISSNTLTITASKEKTPAPFSVRFTASTVSWDLEDTTGPDKFRIYLKDLKKDNSYHLWQDSYRLLVQCEGYDVEWSSCRMLSLIPYDGVHKDSYWYNLSDDDVRSLLYFPLQSGHKYKIGVKAYDKRYGKWSDLATDQLYYLSTPDVSFEQTENGISFRWDAVSGATKYLILRECYDSEDEKDRTKRVTITGNDQTFFLDEQVTPGYNYRYYFRAGRGDWVSADSEIRITFNVSSNPNS